MSDDIKELVQRLRSFRPTYGWPEEQATVVMQTLGDEAADALEAMAAERDRLKDALVRLRDCNWVIRLPDRMDAVREIARNALEDKDE